MLELIEFTASALIFALMVEIANLVGYLPIPQFFQLPLHILAACGAIVVIVMAIIDGKNGLRKHFECIG